MNLASFIYKWMFAYKILVGSFDSQKTKFVIIHTNINTHAHTFALEIQLIPNCLMFFQFPPPKKEIKQKTKQQQKNTLAS